MVKPFWSSAKYHFLTTRRFLSWTVYNSFYSPSCIQRCNLRPHPRIFSMQLISWRLKTIHQGFFRFWFRFWFALLSTDTKADKRGSNARSIIINWQSRARRPSFYVYLGWINIAAYTMNAIWTQKFSCIAQAIYWTRSCGIASADVSL